MGDGLNGENDLDVVDVWTDGGCLANGKEKARAGIGVYFGDFHPCNISRALNSSFSNNCAEIEAIIAAAEMALLMGVRKLRIHTDSQYVVQAVENWIPIWMENEWKDAKKKEVKNREAFERLLKSLEPFDVVIWEYVKGHVGILGNEQADKFAREGAAAAEVPAGEKLNLFPSQEIYLSNSNVESEFPLPLFLSLKIRNEKVKCMVDSGATKTFISQVLFEKLQIFPSSKSSVPIVVRLADGRREHCNLQVDIPFRLEGKFKILPVFVLSKLPVPCIVGLDFLKAFSIQIDFSIPNWYFQNEIEKRHKFSFSSGSEDTCCGLTVLNQDEEKQLQDLLKAEIVPQVGDILPATDLIEHKIKMDGHPPIKQKFRRVSPLVYSRICEEVRKMLKEGVICESQSPWSSPIVMIKKPDGKFRFCLDYRLVNKHSCSDGYPLPRLEGILDHLKKAKYISTIDLSQAYFQVPLNKDSQPITAFSVEGLGHFEFVRCCFGLSGAPATFQRLMDRLFSSEEFANVHVYLDDILVISETFGEHLKLLRKVLRTLRRANLTINREKSHFCVSPVRYLGFLIDEEGIHLDSEKVAPILNYPALKSVKQVRSFIGLISWYRRFLKNLATIAEPITRLLKEDQVWIWSEEQEKAFAEIKNQLTSPPVMSHPDFNLKFTIQTNASAVGLGAVLLQVQNGQEKVIAYASRTMTRSERKWSLTERECLAVFWAIKKFRPYIEGVKFDIATDTNSFNWLYSLKEPSGRLAHWIVELQTYDFQIVKRKNISTRVPAALSRATEVNLVVLEVSREQFQNTRDEWYLRRKRDVEKEPEKHPDWRIENGLLYHQRPNPLIEELMPDLNAWKLVVPVEYRKEILRENHNEPQAGHFGMARTFQKIMQFYFWPNLFREVANYIRKCHICQAVKADQRGSSGIMSWRSFDQPWMAVAVDIVGPLPRSRNGFSYLLVMQDLFSRWVEIAPLRRATGPKVLEAYSELILNRWGSPRYLVNDNGTCFVNTTMDKMVSGTGTKQVTCPIYHPASNPVERTNRVLKTFLAAFVHENHRDWDLHLQEFRFAYNTAYHSSLQATPAFINLGRELIPIENTRENLETPEEIPHFEMNDWKGRMQKLNILRRLIVSNVRDAHDRQATQFNRRQRVRSFSLGDIVKSRNRVLSSGIKGFAAKLAPKYAGPFRIVKRFSRNVYGLSDLEGHQITKVHVTDIQPYVYE